MIVFEDVSYTYPGGVKAIRSVSLEIGDGEFVGLIGHSGAGKTTLAKLAVGLLKPQEGRVLVDGVDTRAAAVSDLARRVGYVFQNPDLMIFSRTIFDEVAFGLRNLGVPEDEVRERVARALEEVDLAHKPLDTPPYALSFGEKHRLAIASVLAMEPRTLILDEPTTGLDYGRCLKLFEVLKRLRDEGRTVVLITHDIDLLARYADRIVVLEEGRVARDGSVREVLGDLEFLEEHGFVPTQVLLLAKRLGLDAITPSELAEKLCSRLGPSKPPTEAPRVP
ncbi:MAG: ABC transporter ATP-binding protein [Thermoprotei archaeon]|nr:MAG: ABC transporter ATP-binding protein [Thermoprotei archaeon]